MGWKPDGSTISLPKCAASAPLSQQYSALAECFSEIPAASLPGDLE